MSSFMKPMLIAAGAALLLAAATGAGYRWGRSRVATAAQAPGTPARAPLYWYDPMVPQERYSRPGKSSMGMDLIPRYAKEPDAGDGIRIDAAVQQNLGMRTAVVTRGSLPGGFSVPGTITWDLRRERVLSLPVDAILDRLYVRAPFDTVRAGQPLARVVVREWSTAMAEARALANARTEAARSLQGLARARLRALGMPPGAVPDVRGGITLAAAEAGVVTEIGARDGEAVTAGALLFRLNGLDTVWLEASIPPNVAGNIMRGTPVEARMAGLPGQVFDARIDRLLPQVDATSRTRKARIVLDNASGLLVPGMYAQVDIRPVDAIERPLVPTEALIGSGSRMHVIVRTAEGAFAPVAVTPGRSGGGRTEILSGLEGGEHVVTSGQFLIDSEANLSGALQRLGAVPGESAPAAAPSGTKPAAPSPTGSAAGDTPNKVRYWYDPMEPGKRYNAPGKSSMGMTLVPMYADEAVTAPVRP